MQAAIPVRQPPPHEPQFPVHTVFLAASQFVRNGTDAAGIKIKFLKFLIIRPVSISSNTVVNSTFGTFIYTIHAKNAQMYVFFSNSKVIYVYCIHRTLRYTFTAFFTVFSPDAQFPP